MKKIILIIIIGIFATSCCTWDWNENPYAIDIKNQLIINADGDIIKFDDPRFERGFWFPEENIAELKIAIEEIKRCREKAAKSYKKCR